MIHLRRALRPCEHYVRPVSLRTRLGLLVGHFTCHCYWGWQA